MSPHLWQKTGGGEGPHHGAHLLQLGGGAGPGRLCRWIVDISTQHIYTTYLDIYLGEHLPDEARVPDRRVGEELHTARDAEPSLARGQQTHAGGDRLDSVSR